MTFSSSMDVISLSVAIFQKGASGNEVACAWLRGVRGPCGGTMAPSLEVDMLVNTILLVGRYILWLKMRVRVVDDSVHVGVGTD